MSLKFTLKRFTASIAITQWLPHYKPAFIRWDIVAGITLASFVLPESMAYATLAGVPAYYGIYCCLAGGLVFALFTTSKQVAVGPTSAISLMIGSTVALLSGGDLTRWAEIAALTALAVAAICFIAFVFKLSALVNFISDSILVGFKAGAALSIMSTQLPKLFSVDGSGSHFFARIFSLLQNLSQTNWPVFLFGAIALALLVAGDKLLPGKPVSLFVVIAAILVVSYTAVGGYGIHVTGVIPGGLPAFAAPSLRIKDVDGVTELAFACFLVGYIETISAARTLALKNNYEINPRQELLSMGFANLAAAFFSGYVISGGLSQSTVNDKSGAKTPMALIICSAALAMILVFFTGLLKNLPEVILAAIVLHAVAGLIKIKELKRIYQLSRVEFAVAMIAFSGVLFLGILKGVMVAAIMSVIFLVMRLANPNVALLGRIGNTGHYSDVERHPDNRLLDNIIILRIESSVLYFNAENIHHRINEYISAYTKDLQLLVLDLSAASYVDVAGSSMLLQLSRELHRKKVQLKVVEALSGVRDILRKQGMEDIVGHISRRVSIDTVVNEFESGKTINS
ncbi:MAG TPA: SulP family inorganic anion transporter [Panacibacter sp.]|nr:SulP family inorganic anion transporter [Panacibacter sp.]HNP46608.1 SulP family inorganic anion transporter [Panacibacter sp.]